MNAQEMMDKYLGLYEYMAQSKKPENMMAFGKVMTAMIEDMIQNSPSKAEEYINRLEAIKWDNYLTPKEAEQKVASMNPIAPWSREQWKQEMVQHGYELEKWPCYNSCALWVTMNMLMSESSQTMTKYVDKGNLFNIVHDLAVDKLAHRKMQS